MKDYFRRPPVLIQTQVCPSLRGYAFFELPDGQIFRKDFAARMDSPDDFRLAGLCALRDIAARAIKQLEEAS